MGEVQARQWTLTDEFAYSVCQLPVKYKRGDEYFQFLEDWGTVSCLLERNCKISFQLNIAVKLQHATTTFYWPKEKLGYDMKDPIC